MIRKAWNSHLRTAVFAAAGGLAGLLYYETVGCRSGGT